MDRFKTRPLLASLAAAAIAALGVGGVAIAQSGPTTPEKPGQERSAPENSATDKDNIQSENGKDDATEKGGAAEKPEKGGKAEKPGSEKPNDDGADGGHADEAKK
ncbi:MAG: hypothetical protein QOI91_2254 [Solirubrobacteraceae bacterium]|nr:hypothetical protein [Solirubrobacteraceae bacterium]